MKLGQKIAELRKKSGETFDTSFDAPADKKSGETFDTSFDTQGCYYHIG